MNDLLSNPAIQSGAVPFVTALLVAALLGFTAKDAKRFAGLAVLIGFLVAYALTLGLPPLPPISSGQKIPYIALLAGITGLILEGGKAAARTRLFTALVVAVLAIAWIGWRKIMATPSLDHLFVLPILAGTSIALVATERDGEDGSDQAISLLVVSLAIAGIAFMGSSASISQNAGALGAALGGLLILNWPKRRFGLNVTARLPPLITLTALATQATLFTKAPAWVLIILLPAFFADRLVDRWMPANSHQAPLARPVLLAFFAAVPAAAALAAAWITASSSDLSGGY